MRILLQNGTFRGWGIKTIVHNVEILLDVETLGIILGVPIKEVRSIEGCKPSSGFSTRATKRGHIKLVRVPKKFLKGEYH
ncbi:hypothetical protein H5410_004415 [Solanum commersonii]|uniref:Uncharacterized protein n=1 Tax=Solanum commersonii TaxID=4109 RepID=A0A9J6B7Y5_SOLCO|nr:hypothetical protein H5410_004415 [Solanum commersonii]